MTALQMVEALQKAVAENGDWDLEICLPEVAGLGVTGIRVKPAPMKGIANRISIDGTSIRPLIKESLLR